jgi:hypothetical protein
MALGKTILDRLDQQVVVRTPPTLAETLLVHALYLFGFVVIAAAILAFKGIRGPLAAVASSSLMLAACVCMAYLYYAAFIRSPPARIWFLSHLHWLGNAYAMLILAFLLGLLTIFFVALFALDLPPVAYLIYALMGGWALMGLWFCYRVLRGYVAFLRRQPVGLLRWAARLEDPSSEDGAPGPLAPP